MNVLMLSLDERVFERGSEVRSRMLRLAKHVQSLHIIVFAKQTHPYEVHGRKLFITAISSSFSPRALWRAFQHARVALGLLRRPAIITSQDAFMSLIAFLLRLISGVPVQVQLHTDFMALEFRNESWKNYFRYLAYRWSVRYADCVRVVSERIRRSVIDECGIPNERVSVLSVPIDRDRINDLRGPNIRALHPQKHPIILVVARLSREKNVALAIEIFAQFLRRSPHAILAIVGDGPEREKIEVRVNQLAIKQSVHFFGWQANPFPFYRAADALLVTSRYEGFGRMFMEAAMLNCPIVSTDVGIVGELLIPGKSVLAFRIPEEAVRNLREATTNQELRKELISNGQVAAAALPSVDQYAQRFQELLVGCHKEVMTKRHFPKYY